jgi:integrase/recombinase XerD
MAGEKPAKRTNSIIRLLPGPSGARRGRAKAVGSGGGPPKDRLPRYLTQEELRRFHKAVVGGGSPRDIALFGLMYRFGLRAAEVTWLLREHLDLVRGRIRIRRAKHGDAKEYPLPRSLAPLLRRSLRQADPDCPFLFTGRESDNQHGLQVLQVQRLFKRYAAAAGLAPTVASHSLRHSIAVHALEEGFGLEYVADLLGHTSIRSTAIYAKVTAPGREAMVKRLDKSRHVVNWG